MNKPLAEGMCQSVGFTDRVLDALRSGRVPIRDYGDIVPFQGLPAELLLALAEVLPAGELEERQNKGPTIQAFIDLALLHPEAKFEGYVVKRERADERLSIEGCWIPREVEVKATPIAPYLPADLNHLCNGQRHLWWD